MAFRTYGLSGSGMDVDQMVKDLMKARRAQYDTLYQKKTQLEWKKSDYNSIYTTLSEFRTNTVMSYKLQSTLQPKTVGSNNDAVAAATANGDAADVPHTLKVHSLAEGVTKASADKISGENSKFNLQTQFGLTQDNFSFTIKNGSTSAEISFTKDETIYDLVSKINNSNTGIKASYDATLDRFFMYTQATGADTSIEITGTDASFVNDKLQISTSAAANAVKGTDATFDLDGVTGITQSGNSFTIAGVTYNLKGIGDAKITVASDTEKIIDSVKSFIASYNATLGKINGELSETKYSKFLPLTDAQKADMKEADIKAWEEKAKSGLLRNDTTLRSIVVNMRSALSAPVTSISGKYNSAAAIGITTGAYQEGGKLYLDEAKLRKALAEDPEAVTKLFGNTGETSSQQGIAVRLYDTLKTSVDKITTEAGITASASYDTKSNLAIRIHDYEDRMDTMSDWLDTLQERYYKQFDAMEAAISKLNSQSSWLANQLGTS